MHRHLLVRTLCETITFLVRWNPVLWTSGYCCRKALSPLHCTGRPESFNRYLPPEMIISMNALEYCSFVILEIYNWPVVYAVYSSAASGWSEITIRSYNPYVKGGILGQIKKAMLRYCTVGSETLYLAGRWGAITVAMSTANEPYGNLYSLNGMLTMVCIVNIQMGGLGAVRCRG